MLRPALLGINACLLMAGGLLFARRAGGGLVEPLSPAGLIATGLAVAVVGWGLRLAWSRLPGAHRPRWQATAVDWTPTVALVLIGAAVSLQGTSPLALAVFWVLLVGCEVAQRILWRSGRQSETSAASAAISAGPTWNPPTPQLAPESMASTDEQPYVMQQVTRTRDAQGREALSGMLRCDLDPGQRSATLHVAFCPPFASVPRLESHQTDGPACRIKVGQLFAYGARLDVRLSQPASEAGSVSVYFSAQQHLGD
ncbi:MAG: hypothetical protein WDZ59_06950 [Pirellulales bacterium]